MRFIRFIDADGATHYGLRGDGDSAELLAGDPYTGLAPTGEHATIDRLLAPIEPVNIFGIGLNYRAHADETGAEVPTSPVVFMKPITALNHPGAPIVLPAACESGPEVDYEAELGVIIGRTALNVSEAEALDHVLGYTCANDVSARRWQKHGGGGQWVRGKSFNGFCPLGPELVTADEVADPQALTVRSRLNGKVMQEQGSKDMLFPVRRLIAELSRDLTLLPGTLILTGTPEGVGFTRNPPVFLQPGDEIVIEIDGIGRLANPVRAADGE